MAATNKNELHDLAVKEFEKLDGLLKTLTVAQANKKHDDDTSIKDVIGHRAHWILLFLGWYKDGLAGKEVFFPAKGYKWNELKRYNAALRATQKSLKWKDAAALLRRNHKKLLSFVASHSNAELYKGPMKGAKNNWPPGRWAEAAGPSHYRSAAKFIRSCIRKTA